MQSVFSVSGMHCAACASAVEKAVTALDGVRSVDVSLMLGLATVEYDDNLLNEEKIIQEVVASGYGAQVRDATSGATAAADTAAQGADLGAAERAQMRVRLWGSVAFLVPLMVLSMGPMVGLTLPGVLGQDGAQLLLAVIQLLLCVPIVVLGGSFFGSGLRALVRRAPNMDTLIALGSGAALGYSVLGLLIMAWAAGTGDMHTVHTWYHQLYFESAATILTLITVGKALEARSRGKTTAALGALLDLAPKTAVRRTADGGEETISVDAIQPGDVLLVRAGEQAAADGVVHEGSASFDQSSLTGESVPVWCAAGGAVYAGTLCTAGFVAVTVQKVGAQTGLSQLIALVERASASKAPIARLADRVCGVFVPIVLGLAAVTVAVWLLVGQSVGFALGCGIAVLVISCPCALGLATPVAVITGMGRGARAGILFQSAAALEHLGRARVALVDKTGTITRGKPMVRALFAAGATEDEVLAWAAALERPSSHPLGQAIVAAAEERALSLPAVQDFAQQAGQGVSGVVDGVPCHAGNAVMLHALGLSNQAFAAQAAHEAEQGATPLYFVRDGAVVGLISVADLPKKHSAHGLAWLRALGLRTVMLSGDNAQTAHAVARGLPLDDVIADVLPGQKEEAVRAAQKSGEAVLMIGDGINDAPALAAADCSMAMGGGTEVAMQTAQVILIKDDLRDAAAAVKLSRATRRIIVQNLFWAFFYNVLGIPLAAGVLYPAFGWTLSPMIAAAAMSVSSIFVVTNALRLRNVPLIEAEIEENEENEENTPTLGETKEKIMNQFVLSIEGMSCGHCTGRVETTLRALPGVTAVTVTLEPGQAVVEGDAQISAQMLREAVDAAGYPVTAVE